MSVRGDPPDDVTRGLRVSEAPEGIEDVNLRLNTGKGYGSSRYNRINLAKLREFAHSACHGPALKSIDTLYTLMKKKAVGGYTKVKASINKDNRAEIKKIRGGRGAEKRMHEDHSTVATFQKVYRGVRQYALSAPDRLRSAFVDRKDVHRLCTI